MVAHDKDDASIAKDLGADGVIFQTLDDVTKSCAAVAQAEGLSDPQTFEIGVFCGNYVTTVPEGYLDHLEEARSQRREGPKILASLNVS